MAFRIPLTRIAQSLIAEGLCSFIFGYIVYSCILNTKFEDKPASPLVVNLAIAFGGTAIIYTFADLTISHFNPAITLAAILTLKLDPLNGIGFIIAQLIGFILACCLLVVNFPGGWMNIMGQVTAGSAAPEVTRVNIFFSEFTLTAILVFVAFSVGLNAMRDPSFSLYGDEPLPNRTLLAPLTIGFTLGFLSFLAGKTSGGAFNPGLVFAPPMMSMDWFDIWWLYILPEFLGGLFGALLQVWVLFK